MYFYTWEGYQDQGQDAGFGICQDCQDWAQKREDEFVKDAIKEVLPNLKPENQAKIKKMTIEEKRHVVARLIEKGALKWQIGK